MNAGAPAAQSSYINGAGSLLTLSAVPQLAGPFVDSAKEQLGPVVKTVGDKIDNFAKGNTGTDPGIGPTAQLPGVTSMQVV
jgi:hypothetical protein